jgi:hypothetical protein
VGTNPFNYLNKELVLSLDYFRAYVSHEWRLDVMTDSRKPLTTSENTIVFMYYKGFQGSYTLKFNSLPQNGRYIYWGPQIRYTYRKLKDTYDELDPKEFGLQQVNQIVHASNYELALTMMIGKIYRFNHYFIDMYTGIGPAYRWLKTDVDLNKYSIQDEILNASRWNQAYLAVRLGIRIGVLIRK